ncbi:MULTISPECIES: hypothetical protein [unclassified Brevibacillus]|uniref:hypothetical protein n=1 Tax=unclassified Brevibacillus TaxID=2684853 RepID=UPI0035698BEB
MSRSYKKTPVCKDEATRFTKRLASKAVRRYKDTLSNGKHYRKVFCSWIICDYRFYEPLQKAIHDWEKSPYEWAKKMTKKDLINSWSKAHYRK